MSCVGVRWLAAAGLAIGASALAAVTPEIEPNEGKATATIVVGPMLSGDSITGSSIGTSAAAGATSRDFFRLTVAPSAVPAIYRNRMTFATAQAHTGAIMGTAQSGAASDTTTIQTTSTTTTPPRFSQWYSFGSQHDLHYRVQGATATTAPYEVVFDQVEIVPVDIGAFQPGTVSMTTFGQGHTTDTEMYLLDSGFNFLRQNDDRPSPATDFQSIITEDLSPGTYFLAISTFNTANSNANEAAATERSTTGNRMDFGGSLARASASTTASNVSFAVTDTEGTTPFAASLAGPYEIYFAKLTIVPAPGAAALFGLAGLVGLRRRR